MLSIVLYIRMRTCSCIRAYMQVVVCLSMKINIHSNIKKHYLTYDKKYALQIKKYLCIKHNVSKKMLGRIHSMCFRELYYEIS